MKKLIILILFGISLFAFGCSTPVKDVEFAYFAKPQENRKAINDVFFNSSHSAYQKYRVYPDAEVKSDEVAIFDQNKLPANYNPASDEFMFDLVRTLKKLDFFVLGRSVDSFKQAVQIYQSQDFIKQCFVLIVDGHVTIVLPPKSPGRTASKSAIDKFNSMMSNFHKYGKIYIAYSQEFKRVNVETNTGIETFDKENDRTRQLSEEERRNIEEHRNERDRIHGDN